MMPNLSKLTKAVIVVSRNRRKAGNKMYNIDKLKKDDSVLDNFIKAYSRPLGDDVDKFMSDQDLIDLSDMFVLGDLKEGEQNDQAICLSLQLLALNDFTSIKYDGNDVSIEVSSEHILTMDMSKYPNTLGNLKLLLSLDQYTDKARQVLPLASHEGSATAVNIDLIAFTAIGILVESGNMPISHAITNCQVFCKLKFKQTITDKFNVNYLMSSVLKEDATFSKPTEISPVVALCSEELRDDLKPGLYCAAGLNGSGKSSFSRGRITNNTLVVHESEPRLRRSIDKQEVDQAYTTGLHSIVASMMLSSVLRMSVIFDSFKDELYALPGASKKGGLSSGFTMLLTTLDNFAGALNMYATMVVNPSIDDYAFTKDIFNTLATNSSGAIALANGAPMPSDYKSQAALSIGTTGTITASQMSDSDRSAVSVSNVFEDSEAAVDKPESIAEQVQTDPGPREDVMLSSIVPGAHSNDQAVSLDEYGHEVSSEPSDFSTAFQSEDIPDAFEQLSHIPLSGSDDDNIFEEINDSWE